MIELVDINLVTTLVNPAHVVFATLGGQSPASPHRWTLVVILSNGASVVLGSSVRDGSRTGGQMLVDALQLAMKNGHGSVVSRLHA